MAIALDVVTNGANNNNALSVTVTGSNPVLLAFIEGDTTDTMSGATYNGVAMTLVDKVKTPSDRWQYCFVMFNPPTGAHTLATSGSTFMQINAESLTGVLSTSIDAFTDQTGTGVSSITKNLTVVGSSCWIVIGGYSNTGTGTAGSGFTNRGSIVDGLRIMDTNGTVSSGTNACAFSATGSNNMSLIAVSISPTGVTTTTGGSFLNNFV